MAMAFISRPPVWSALTIDNRCPVYYPIRNQSSFVPRNDPIDNIIETVAEPSMALIGSRGKMWSNRQMPYQFLNESDRSQLSSSIERLDAAWGGAVTRWSMLTQAGLSELLPGLTELADSSAREFTVELIAALEDGEWLGGQPPTQVLGALLRYVSQQPDIPRDIYQFYLTLLVRYELDDAANLTLWRTELGEGAPQAVSWQSERRFSHTVQRKTIKPITISRYLSQCWQSALFPDPPSNAKNIRPYRAPLRLRVPNHPGGQGGELFATVQSVLNVNEVSNHLRRVVILGDEGGGKTSALLRLRRKQAARSCRTNRKTTDRKDLILPILINLDELQIAPDIRTLVHESINSLMGQGEEKIGLDQIDRLLAEYRCLFLFDGLESVPQPGGAQIVRRFIEKNSTHLYVLTCRTSAYRGQLGGSVSTLFIDDLSDNEARRVLGDKYKTLNKELRPLVQNRSLMKIVLSSDESLDHVQSKGRLLGSYFSKMLRDSNVQNSESMELYLEELAFAMLFSRSRHYSEYQIMQFTQKFIDEWHESYTWRQIADLLRGETGLLTRNDQQRLWAFREERALTYFAAAAMAREPSRIGQVLNDLQGVWWRETLSLLIGLLPDPNDLCYQLIDRDIFIAATCIRLSGRNVDERIIDALVDVFTERFALQNSQDRRRVAMLLGESGHPRAIQVLLEALHREWSSYALVGILNAIAAWSKEVPSQPLSSYLEALLIDKETTLVVEECVNEIISPDGEKGNIAYYRKLLGRNHRPRVRGLAALGLGFAQDAEARKLLVANFCEPPDDAFVTWCVVEALTMYKDDEKVIQAARQVYDDPQSLTIKSRRAQAVYLLGWLKDDGQTTPLLAKALSDPDPETRGYAVYALARLDLIGARRAIEKQLTVEDNPQVLRKIAESLSEIGDIGSLDELEQALNGPGAQTRWAIQKAIREIRERHELLN